MLNILLVIIWQVRMNNCVWYAWSHWQISHRVLWIWCIESHTRWVATLARLAGASYFFHTNAVFILQPSTRAEAMILRDHTTWNTLGKCELMSKARLLYMPYCSHFFLFSLSSFPFSSIPLPFLSLSPLSFTSPFPLLPSSLLPLLSCPKDGRKGLRKQESDLVEKLDHKTKEK